MLRKCADNIFVVLILAQVSTCVVIRSQLANEGGGPSSLPSELFKPIVAPTEQPLHIAPVANGGGQEVNSAPSRNDDFRDSRNRINNNNNNNNINERWTPISNTQWPNQNNLNIPYNNDGRTFDYSVPSPNGQFVQYQYQSGPQHFHGSSGSSRHFSGSNLDPNNSNGMDPTFRQFGPTNGNHIFRIQGFRTSNNDLALDDVNGRLQNFRPQHENDIDFSNGDGGGLSSHYVVRSSSWHMNSDMDKPAVRQYEYDSRDGVPREIFLK